MRKKRRILWGSLLICSVLAGVVAVYKPWRDIAFITGLIVYTDIKKPNDPSTRTLRDAPADDWGMAVALTPLPLEAGLTRGDVEKMLAKGKFKPDETREFSWRHPRTFSSESLYYSKTVEGLPCALRYVVVVRYDDRHRLVEATGTEDEAGCL